MKLRDPAIQFRSSGGTLCAKSTADHRWYKVHGITKALDSLMHRRKRSSGHDNMMSMDLFARVVRDVNVNPESSLEWVCEYLRDLNAPDSKGSAFQAELLKLYNSKALTPEACRRLWDRSRMSACIGVRIDGECKDVFNGKKALCDAGPVSRLILTQLKALHLTPICAGLKVAGVPTPDRFIEGESYTYHNRCTQGCKSVPGTQSSYTEVDLLAYDPVKNNIALLELKTRNNDILDNVTLWRYNTQLWLTWIMFSLTYPSMAEISAAYLVIIRPGTNQVTIRSCLRPTVSKGILNKFPWLTCFCPRVLNCLAPTCVNMRVETRSTARKTTDRIDPADLCYRNILFNQEKLKNSARGSDAPVLTRPLQQHCVTACGDPEARSFGGHTR